MWCRICGKFDGDHADYCERKGEPLPVRSESAGSVLFSQLDIEVSKAVKAGKRGEVHYDDLYDLCAKLLKQNV